jgi:hypothetical protein
MSLSCYDKMLIENENSDITPSFKRMKLASLPTNTNSIVVNSIQDPFQKLKSIFPYMEEEVQ